MIGWGNWVGLENYFKLFNDKLFLKSLKNTFVFVFWTVVPNTLIGLMCVMFYQNWKLSLIAILMIPFATIAAKSLGKRIGKVTTEAQEKAGEATQYLMELFKNHKLIKIFQKEDYESDRSSKFLYMVKEKGKNQYQ